VYDEALAEVKEANRLSGDAKWLEFETRIRLWRADAERLKNQDAAVAEQLASGN
jgi:hypothetical protein